jgi:molybdopterin converting factor subunit 1
MEVEVRLFAMLRERAGRDSMTVELGEGATVADALDVVGSQHGLDELIDRMPVVTAVNREYVPKEQTLAEGDELALIPPVSGGEGEAELAEFRTGDGYESPLVADGRVVHLGKSVAFLEGSLADGDGNVVATATATARVVKLKNR